MSGVFQIDRGIFQNDIWNNVAEFRVFFYIVGNAVWKEEGIYMGDIHVKRGQYLRSYRNLREDLMYVENNAIKYYSISHLKTITDKLKSDGRIEKQETRLGTLFTVLNYGYYQGFNRFEQPNQEQLENGERTEQEQNKNNKKKDNKDKNDIYITTIADEQTETGKDIPVADMDADFIQQEEESVAQVGTDPTKQINPVEKIERHYLQIRNRNMCSSKDMADMVNVYEKYQDIDFIARVMKSAAEENKARNGRITINSFSYFMPIFQDEWEKMNMQKEGVKNGPTPRDSKQNFKFDKSQFLWGGGEN
ncbi:hypothetical protein [Clostridium sp. Cult2]|uniref:hypothetical protein n=1 Tax=Clostridium sp. Cult2 TaxID=2079003 RepID=UPI001F3DB09E|nr:hypothetical protein [Clostridium sp. Cult2]MCF6466379.1 hypothetical protein [Clostridium sp. Cult2]